MSGQPLYVNFDLSAVPKQFKQSGNDKWTRLFLYNIIYYKTFYWYWKCFTSLNPWGIQSQNS